MITVGRKASRTDLHPVTYKPCRRPPISTVNHIIGDFRVVSLINRPRELLIVYSCLCSSYHKINNDSPHPVHDHLVNDNMIGAAIPYSICQPDSENSQLENNKINNNINHTNQS
jgi:hypothetical protein